MWADVFLAGMSLFVLLLVVTAVAHIWIPVPYIPTPMAVARLMVREARLTGRETVYDLGAGDGRLVIEAARAHPGVRAVGIEFVPTVWALGKLRIAFARVPVTFRLGNVLRQDLADADCIFLYLIPKLMRKLEAKFDRELKPGTTVISYAFHFPERAPVRKVKVPWLGTERYLWVYQWSSIPARQADLTLPFEALKGSGVEG